MAKLLKDGAELERLATGATWGEGPVWLQATRTVVWSDIPGNRILQWSADTGRMSVYREDAEYANGRTLDLDGHIVQCSHGRRAIERDRDGVLETIVDRYGASRLNSPNDVVVASDGAIWFTDPPYGIISTVEGRIAEQEYDGCYVFRYDESTGRLDAMITDMEQPNGLAFSPDESVLYVADTAYLRDPNGARHVRAYDVVDGKCTNGRVWAVIEPGAADGFRIDEEGRMWTSSEDSVQVLSPAGDVLLKIPMPEKVGNLCFGGDDGTDVFIAARTSLYRIATATRQAPRP